MKDLGIFTSHWNGLTSDQQEGHYTPPPVPHGLHAELGPFCAELLGLLGLLRLHADSVWTGNLDYTRTSPLTHPLTS
jgi:hypothetical protein